MNLLLFLVTIVILTIIVKIGAIAFELTGLEGIQAQFQALSCFTGTGYTTKESELVMAIPQRRRIASVMMILGYAGFVTSVATLANSLTEHATMLQVPIPYISQYIPLRFVPWVNFIVLVVLLLAIVKILRNTKIAKRLTDTLRSHIVKRNLLQPVSFHEMVVASGGYGVTRIDIGAGSSVIDKSPHDLQLRKNDIYVLAIQRKGKTISMPTADTKIHKNDSLICFGKLDAIRKELLPEEDASET